MPDENYDVDAAVTYLDNHAHLVPQHRCAMYIRKALAAGGIVIHQGEATEYAKNYGSLLLQNGYAKVFVNELLMPKKGDIAVIQPYPDGNPAGHITMYNGRQWISDFKQRDMWSGPGYRKYKPAYQVYRWQGKK